MVYNTNTMKPLHELTDEGEEIWSKLAAVHAEQQIFKAAHPFKWFFLKLLRKVD